MTVLTTQVPFSGWTVAVMVFGSLAAIVLARPLAQRAGWQRPTATTTLLLLVAVLSMTLTPGSEAHVNGTQNCLPDDLPDLVDAVARSGGGLVGNLLNLLLLLPLAGSVVVLTGRIAPAATMAVLLPVIIEATQTRIPGRYCSLSDLITNISGALAGVALGYWLLRRRASTAA